MDIEAVTDDHQGDCRPFGSRQMRLKDCLAGDPERENDFAGFVFPLLAKDHFAGRFDLEVSSPAIGADHECVRRSANARGCIAEIKARRDNLPFGAHLGDDLKRVILEQAPTLHGRCLFRILADLSGLERPVFERRQKVVDAKKAADR